MARKIDLVRVKNSARSLLIYAIKHYESAIPKTDYWLQRWIAQMTAVEIHAAWERYVEVRLVVALNHSPEHFLQENKSRYH
jgi:hypothetical protein